MFFAQLLTKPHQTPFPQFFYQFIAPASSFRPDKPKSTLLLNKTVNTDPDFFFLVLSFYSKPTGNSYDKNLKKRFFFKFNLFKYLYDRLKKTDLK